MGFFSTDSINEKTGSSDTGLYGYAYDHRTRRVVRDESAVSGRDLSLIVFSSGTSVQEHTTSISANPAVEYIRGSDYGGGIGGILYTLRSGTPAFNHYNSRGDVVAKTDALGDLSWQAQYEAFGTRTTEVGTNPDRQKANTKDEDPTGLLNEGFRYRDLGTGTFITRDPLGFVDGPNVYTYVVQNPWTFFDPLGLQNGAKRNKPPTDQMFYPRLAHSIFVKPFVEAQRAGQVHLEHAAVEAGDGNIGMTVSHTAAALFHAVSTAVVEIGPGKVVKGADTINDVRKGVDATVDLSRGADGFHDMQRAADGATDLNAANRTAETADTAGDTARQTGTSERPLRAGDEGLASDLQKQRRQHGSEEALHVDHQPSFAAQVRAEERRLNRELTSTELAELRRNTPAVASPADVHRQTSPTYGGRNTPDQIETDSVNLDSAQARDRAIFDEAMEDR